MSAEKNMKKFYKEKDRSYFSGVREDIISLIPHFKIGG
jgi:hypothetical protein